jgi:RNA polymerase sigma-70 factor (ECF subfamily)
MGGTGETGAMADSGSFEEFYSAAVGRLLGQLFPVTGDLYEAEEVVQEAFTRAAVRWTRLRDYDVPEAWVRRVAMNLAADRARSLRRQASAMLRVSPPPEVPPVSVEALALAAALRTLPIRQRQVIVLYHLVDLPVEEVARTLAMPDVRQGRRQDRRVPVRVPLPPLLTMEETTGRFRHAARQDVPAIVRYAEGLAVQAGSLRNASAI